MLEVGSLDRGTQALVLVGLSVVFAAALLLTLVGLDLPKVQLFQVDGHPIRMALPFFLAVIAVFSIGWGYILAAVLGCSPWLRWPALGVFTAALLDPVASALTTAQAQGIRLDVPTVLPVAAPELALLAPVWTIAVVRAIARRRSITPFTVTAMTIFVVLYFAIYYYMEVRFAGESTQGAPVIQFMTLSLTFLLPLYLLAGVDLSELLVLTGGGALAWVGPRVGRRSSLLLSLVVGASALAVEAILDPVVFSRAASLAYAAAWLLINLIFLRWIIRPARIVEPASYPLLFLIIAVAWFSAGGYVGIPELPGGPPVALSVAGGGCLLAAAGLSFLARSRQSGPILLLGLIGFWLLFFNLPTALGVIPISRLDFLGAVVVGSAVTLIAVGLAAERYPLLAFWRAPLTLWALAIALVRTYVLIIVRAASVHDVLPAIQVGILLVALGVVLVSVPLPLRVGASGLALAGLLASVGFALFGGPLRVVAIANATVLAIAVVWEVLMSGQRITNRRGRHWPRESRVIGFLGYALAGLAVALFAATAEGREAAGLTLTPSDFPAIGLVLFGVPTALYVLRAAWRPQDGSLELNTEF